MVKILLGGMQMLIGIDHIVLNCKDVEYTADWYERVLRLKREVFGPESRIALKFGNQKINLRPIGAKNWITSKSESEGSVDICFITNENLSLVKARIEGAGVEIIQGPVEKIGSLGSMMSIYLRDPEGSLLEISSYNENHN
jgi:catechol 2,3-dioxygenase-like lactoylglutathione lyase family enzyme